jgi:thiol-disulfide isomerase/thioredoxin
MRLLLAWYMFLSALTSISNAAEPGDSIWPRLQALNDQANEKVPLGTNAVEFYAPREKALHAAAADYVKRFPGDPHQSQVLLWKIETTDFQGSAEQRISLLKQNEMDGRQILQDPALPSDLRYEVRRTILTQWLDNPELITAPDQAADFEKRIAELVQMNPTEPRAITLELARADLMLRFDHEKGVTLLQDFINGADRDLAEAAKTRLLKAQIIGKSVDLEFTAVDGSPIDLRALRGKIVLVDFWATWCPDCIREMPVVRQVYQKYKDKGFTVLGISLDKDPEALSNFVAKKLISWPQYFDGNGWETKYAAQYGVRAIPEMWLINQRGEVVSTDVSVDQLEQEIQQIRSSGGQVSRN